MPRSVNSVASRARRKKIIKQAKGYFGRRKNVWTVAKNAVDKAMLYAFRDRRNKKRSFRALWIMRINAGARLHGMSLITVAYVTMCAFKMPACSKRLRVFKTWCYKLRRKSITLRSV